MSRRCLLVALTLAVTACGVRVPPRPAGAETPDPAAVQAFPIVTRPCVGLRTVTAEIRLSGRAGGESLRGTLLAGLAAPASLRFEAVAPFGAPIFVLAGRQNVGTLWFPRDRAALVDVPIADILERLTGLAFGADDLRMVLTGCLGDAASATNGRAWPGGWQAVDLGPGVTAYLRTRGGTTRLVAADYAAWRVDYADHVGAWPRSVRIRSVEAGQVDATARLEQLEINAGIEERAFAVDIPSDADRLTLDHLRAVTPLRGT